MITYFYKLNFAYEVRKDKKGEPISSSFAIGYLSTLKKATEKIEEYKNLTGFNKHPLNCFRIEKIGLRTAYKIKNKEIVDLYELAHEYYIEDEDVFHVTYFGIYSTEEEAETEKRKISRKRIYKKYLENFTISKWRVDRDFEWKEGFDNDDGK
ncbi:MAG: hypothetical protein PHV07_02630 [Oscillospiraceae bacterium]|nr:hypothetical protein [Oscillospiraceae bacterium]